MKYLIFEKATVTIDKKIRDDSTNALQSGFETIMHHYRSVLGLQIELDSSLLTLSTIIQEDINTIVSLILGNNIPTVNRMTLAIGLVTF